MKRVEALVSLVSLVPDRSWAVTNIFMKHLSSHQFMELFKKVGLLQNTFTFLQHIHHRAVWPLFKTSLPKSMSRMSASVMYAQLMVGKARLANIHFICVCVDFIAFSIEIWFLTYIVLFLQSMQNTWTQNKNKLMNQSLPAPSLQKLQCSLLNCFQKHMVLTTTWAPCPFLMAMFFASWKLQNFVALRGWQLQHFGNPQKS